jgi:TetR/AcrR family transcriptional repressor of lmrAB and yxaGH operons
MPATSRRSPQTRESTVRKLVHVFRRCGYDGATLSSISKATDLGRASLYHHFPGGKREMGEAVLSYIGEEFGAIVLAPLRLPVSPRERLDGMAQGLMTFYDHGKNSCLLAVFALADADDLFAEIIRAKLEGWIATVAAVLVEAGLDATIARVRSEDSVILVQGSLLVAHGLGDPRGFVRVVSELPDRLLATDF